MFKASAIALLVAALLTGHGPRPPRWRGHWPWGIPPIVHKSHCKPTSACQTLVIDGDDFGARANYNPSGPGSFMNVAWHDFESNQIAGGNLQLEPTAPYQWSIQHGNGRFNSKSYARKTFIDNRLGELNLTQADTTGTWFVSFWMRVGSVAKQQGGKFFRIWGDNANAYLSTGAGGLEVRGFSECGTCSPEPHTVWTSEDNLTGGWQRVDIEISEAPDMFLVTVDGKTQWRRSSTLAGAEQEQWIPNPFGADGHTLGIGGMLDSADEGWPANGFFDFDDVYIDYTLARVELCDASTWAACTVREIQPVKEWSDNQVTVLLNPGAFKKGRLVYAYVINADGEVSSSGVPVVIPR